MTDSRDLWHIWRSDVHLFRVHHKYQNKLGLLHFPTSALSYKRLDCPCQALKKVKVSFDSLSE
jgi:hypothetical protein